MDNLLTIAFHNMVETVENFYQISRVETEVWRVTGIYTRPHRVIVHFSDVTASSGPGRPAVCPEVPVDPTAMA